MLTLRASIGHLSRRTASSSTTAETLKKTCLHDFHLERGGKMVGFAGYSMPIMYTDLSIGDSHRHTRSNCSIFDVSHMQQSKIKGKDRNRFIESLTTLDSNALEENSGSLTVFTNERGGITDDLIVMNTGEQYLFLVTNAGCKDKDIPLMKAKASQMKKDGFDIDLELIDDHGLIAIQGPKMKEVLQPLTDIDLNLLKFMRTSVGSVCGVHCRITRCGYTGEDGVEVSIPEKDAVAVTRQIMESSPSSVKLAGLGARDSLRLEAGLCLYGNDMDEEKTPVEAGLNWLIAKSRRQTGGFPGHSIIADQLTNKSNKIKRVGLISSGPPPRGGMEILDANANKIGYVTSGCPSPTLQKNVAMGYVDKLMAKTGTIVQVKVRNKMVEAMISKMPFVNSNYYT